MEELIKELGDAFRGLWYSREIDQVDRSWYVTFLHKNDIVETEGHSSPHEALNQAIMSVK